MNIRELVGLTLLIAAVMMAPLGYFISTGWTIAALAAGIPGVVLFFTGRMSDRMASQEPIDGPSYGHHGFHGASMGDGDD